MSYHATPDAQIAWRDMAKNATRAQIADEIIDRLAAWQHGIEAEKAYRAERAAAVVKRTAAEIAVDEAAEQAAEDEWWRQRADYEVMGSDDDV